VRAGDGAAGSGLWRAQFWRGLNRVGEVAIVIAKDAQIDAISAPAKYFALEELSDHAAVMRDTLREEE
jgi:hypothetical protein